MTSNTFYTLAVFAIVLLIITFIPESVLFLPRMFHMM